jgi:hypothetical protein
VSGGDNRGLKGLGRSALVYGVGILLTRVIAVLLPGSPFPMFSPPVLMAIFLPFEVSLWWSGVLEDWDRDWLTGRLQAILPRGWGFVRRIERVV